jgi:anti-sigma-K factor RskA
MDPSMLMEHIDAIGLIPLLIWQSIRMEKKLDAQAEQMNKQRKENDARNVDMIKGWEKQLVALVNKYEEREDEIRSRYDSVISNYNNERDRMFRDMDRKLDDAIRFFQSGR